MTLQPLLILDKVRPLVVMAFKPCPATSPWCVFRLNSFFPTIQTPTVESCTGSFASMLSWLSISRWRVVWACSLIRFTLTLVCWVRKHRRLRRAEIQFKRRRMMVSDCWADYAAIILLGTWPEQQCLRFPPKHKEESSTRQRDYAWPIDH